MCGVKRSPRNVVWYVVKGCCEKAGLERIAPHDLRRTCAKLCHSSGGEIEQIQFLLGHASVQTTERYLGCKQNLGQPVNDRFALNIVVGSTSAAPTTASQGSLGELRSGGSPADGYPPSGVSPQNCTTNASQRCATTDLQETG